MSQEQSVAKSNPSYCPACTFYGSNPKDCICPRALHTAREALPVFVYVSEAERAALASEVWSKLLAIFEE